jgi:DNA-directed RNA polymerase subunit RPC12/RpoP
MARRATIGTSPQGSTPWWARAADSQAPQTADDKRHYVEGGLEPVTCARCATRVLVKKNSPRHTSVQWTSDAAASCPEIGAQVSAGARAGQILGCSMLKQSIEDAMAGGALTLPDA